MSTVKLRIMHLLKEKSNQMNEKFQRFQSELNVALKELSKSIPTSETTQRMHHEIKTKKILSEFSFEMNKLEGKYINLCQTALATMDVDDDQMSHHGSSEEYIDSVDENTANHHNDTPSNATESKSVNKPDAYCNVCHRDFITQTRLKEHHLSVHSDARPFQCSECPKAFKLNRYLLHHIREVHDGYPFPCDQCNQRFKFQNELIAHKKSHIPCGDNHKNESNQWSCTICNIEFMHLRSLRRHNRDKHSFQENDTRQERTDSLLHQQSKNSSHGVTSHSSSKFTKHRSSHSDLSRRRSVKVSNDYSNASRKRRRLSSDSGNQNFAKAKYQCNICFAVFPSGFALLGHKSVHRFSDSAEDADYEWESTFQCSTCGKELSSRDQLRNHMLLHGDERPFECHLCPKAFVIKYRLTNHLIGVHGVKPYKCDLCGEAFSRKRDLVKHERSCLDLTAVLVDDDADVEHEPVVERELNESKSEPIIDEMNDGLKEPLNNEHTAISGARDPVE